MDSNTDSAARYQALLQLLRTADVLWETSRVFFGRWDLGPSQFNVLNLLFGAPEGLSQTDLGRQLLTHRSNVTGLIDRLEKRGLVKRTQASGDRRAYRVVLTGSGARLLRQILPHYHREADRVWDGVTGERITSLLATLHHITSNTGRVSSHRPAKGNQKT